MRKEWLARLLIMLLALAAAAIPLVGGWRSSQGVLLHAHMAETGGWTPENLTVAAGQPLHLRLTSDDVTHSFAIGQSDQPPVEIHPGEVSEVTLVFDKPGKYTFYCTRWCSANHWRMRGVIEVTSSLTQTAATDAPPLYVTLGIDIDAEHHAEVTPAQKPSALRGAAFAQALPPAYLSRAYYLAHTPYQLWQALHAEPALQGRTDQDLWDLAAWVWQSNAAPQARQQGKDLYAIHCAACHGEQGKGDGVFASAQAQASTGNPTPADFTAAGQMLAASPAHLQGKILRGGMGTGMPYWGPIFTEPQTWALVAYLWTFQFEMEMP